MSDWDHDANIHELPNYPEDWPAEQRVGAYWYALNHTGMPYDTKGWDAVWKLAQREHERIEQRRNR